jgi:hypothetical protein
MQGKSPPVVPIHHQGGLTPQAWQLLATLRARQKPSPDGFASLGCMNHYTAAACLLPLKGF